jgi:predicted esterase
MSIHPIVVTLVMLSCIAFEVEAADAGTRPRCQPAGATREQPQTARLVLAGVPAIVRMPSSVTKPPVILWHGFGPPESEAELMSALPLDDVPAVKVYLGLPLFGERAPAREEDSLARRQAEDYATRLFEPAVMGAALELPKVVRALTQMKCLSAGEPIGLFGFSAGGAAVLFALARRDVPIRAAVTVNAPIGLSAAIDALERATKKPYAWTPAARELALRSDALGRAADIAAGSPPPALLLFHGIDDAMVAWGGAASLEGTLRPLYDQAHADRRLRLDLVNGLAHDWRDPKVQRHVRAAVAGWFNRNL